MLLDIFMKMDPGAWVENAAEGTLDKDIKSTWLLPVYLVQTIYHDPWIYSSQHTIWTYFAGDWAGSLASKGNGRYMPTFATSLLTFGMYLPLQTWSGILPYSSPHFTHISISIPLALSWWMTLILSASMFNYQQLLAHHLPFGTPNWLAPFITIIEAISNMIRPVTLGFRFAANLTAGQVIMALISTTLSFLIMNLSIVFMPIMLAVGIFYSLFEMMVAYLQTYIFLMLMSLYASEHPAQPGPEPFFLPSAQTTKKLYLPIWLVQKPFIILMNPMWDQLILPILNTIYSSIKFTFKVINFSMFMLINLLKTILYYITSKMKMLMKWKKKNTN